jgi:glycosyltransferase involved in cell wall biosynthesis
MAKLNILHVIDRFSSVGGAARAMLTNAREWQRLGKGQNQILSLLPADRMAVERARAEQIPVLQSPDRSTLLAHIAEADIVQIHYFNSPILYEFLASPLPPCRALVWCHVGGATAAQALTRDVVEWADRLVVSAPITLSIPCVKNLIASGTTPRVIIGGADFSRLRGIESKPHRGFNVGYIGTLDPVKIHPGFVAMCAEIDVPDVRFVVCSAPSRVIESQARSMGIIDRFEFRGYTDDISSVLEVLDVFGYPLCADNYSSSDQTVQEAMYAGVPCVVFPHGGVPDMIAHDNTGLIVDSPAAYANAIRYLAENPDQRGRLGRNARAYAQAQFGAEHCAPQFDEVYREMMAQPKSERRPLGNRTMGQGESTPTGAELLLLSLGDLAPEFAISAFDKDRKPVRAADKIIAQASPSLRATVSQYSRHFPGDPLLALWAGLTELAAERRTSALIKFRQALATGGEEWRIEEYISDIAASLGANPEAIATTIMQGKLGRSSAVPGGSS